MEFFIQDERGKLQTVLIGRCDHLQSISPKNFQIDPISKKNATAHQIPDEHTINSQVNGLVSLLSSLDITVIRPNKIKHTCPLFVRDLSFVIDKQLFKSHIKTPRKNELKSIEQPLADPFSKAVDFDRSVFIEGGDVILWNDYIFVGYNDNRVFTSEVTARTNSEAIDALSYHFPNRKVIGLRLQKSNTDPLKNALHLDCAFMPFGSHYALIHMDSFVDREALLTLDKIFMGHLIPVTANEMRKFACNLLSISDHTVICSDSTPICNTLHNLGLTVHKVPFHLVERLGGSIRCVTLPLTQKT